MRKAIPFVLAVVLLLSLGACGSEPPPETTAPAPSVTETEPVPGEGQVFRVYSWNEEFKLIFEKYYPVPEGITVEWVIHPNEGGVYKSMLDEALKNQEQLPPEERIDLFLLEIDHDITRYTNSADTQDVKALGVTDFSNAYPYTVQAATDESGTIKGVSFQCCPSALIYRRSIALEVLGTDDPDAVQEALSDWDKFAAVAAQAKEKGYYMTASESETYRVFSNNASAPWVDDRGRLQFDSQIRAWMDQAKRFSDLGYTINTGIWDEEKNDQMFADGKTMCFFGPSWYFNFCMGNAQDPEKGCFGDWAICQGPQAHFWGGTWLMASAYTDNPTMLGDVLDTFLNDEDVCFALVANEAQLSNNQAVNERFAADPSYGNAFLGGQNDVAIFLELAKDIQFRHHTGYDQTINESLQDCWREYCRGELTEAEAMTRFYRMVTEQHPNIMIP
ncbi:MAG: extracellular solute-binding protein [Oscillospiraceae bacterium]|nr:extracellular solute-binding protein [Oscillospiraceae bacterium]